LCLFCFLKFILVLFEGEECSSVGIKQNHGQMEDVPILQIDKTKSRKMLYNVAAKKTKNKKKGK